MLPRKEGYINQYFVSLLEIANLCLNLKGKEERVGINLSFHQNRCQHLEIKSLGDQISFDLRDTPVSQCILNDTFQKVF